MALTLESLVNSVNLEIQNHEKRGSATATGDGVMSAFIVPPLGSYITNDATWGVWLDGEVTTAFTMDFDSGVCTMDSPPAVDSAVLFQFNYKSYNDAVVDQAVNTAIDMLFPSFYVEAIDDTITSGDFEGNELAIEDCEAVIGFMLYDGTTWKRAKRGSFELYKAAGAGVLRFYNSAPTADLMRIHYITRATVSDLPDRAAFPIISYACYYLLLQKTSARTRGDIAIVTQGTGVLSPRQMNDAANIFYIRYQMQLASMKMRPWASA